uniref:Uncharacterized protein n=1 Tax=Lepeophtheirus salmonis TaxID=72036 RepID=A0A0K2UYR0_LEPSM
MLFTTLRMKSNSAKCTFNGLCSQRCSDPYNLEGHIHNHFNHIFHSHVISPKGLESSPCIRLLENPGNFLTIMTTRRLYSEDISRIFYIS